MGILEEWKPVVGFEKYKVSNLGRVLDTRGFIIQQWCNRGGYLAVELSDGHGKKKERAVHRLVAMAFIPNPENKPEVNHKDGNHRNACVDNLEWVTGEENIKHSVENGLAKKPRSLFAGTDEEYSEYSRKYDEEHSDWDAYNKQMIANLDAIEEKRRVYNEARQNTLDELKREKQRLISITQEKKSKANALRNSPEWKEKELEEYIARCKGDIDKHIEANKQREIECDYQDAVIEFLECKKALAAAKCNGLYGQRALRERCGGNSFVCGDVKDDKRKNESLRDRYELTRSLTSCRDREMKFRNKCNDLEIEVSCLRKELQKSNKYGESLNKEISVMREKLQKRDELKLHTEDDSIIERKEKHTNKYYQPILKRPIIVYTEGRANHYPTVTIAAKAHGYRCGQDLLDNLLNKEATIFGTYARYDKIS